MSNQKQRKNSFSKEKHFLLNENKDHDIIDFLTKQTAFNHTAIIKIALRNLITRYGNVDLITIFDKNASKAPRKPTSSSTHKDEKSNQSTNKSNHHSSHPKAKADEKDNKPLVKKQKKASNLSNESKPIPMDQLKFLDPDNLDDL